MWLILIRNLIPPRRLLWGDDGLPNERFDRALNSVLLASGLQAKLDGRTLMVGTAISSKTFGPQMSKVFRLNQVSANLVLITGQPWREYLRNNKEYDNGSGVNLQARPSRVHRKAHQPQRNGMSWTPMEHRRAFGWAHWDNR